MTSRPKGTKMKPQHSTISAFLSGSAMYASCAGTADALSMPVKMAAIDVGKSEPTTTSDMKRTKSGYHIRERSGWNGLR